MKKSSILFVDDDENILHGLKVMLHSMRSSWNMFFAESGAKGLEVLEKEGPFQLVVSDMHMPGMHGTEFLGKVIERYPSTIRFVLSGNLDHETLVESSTVAHQVISKPCDPHHLRNIIMRVLSLGDQLTECTLKQTLLEMGALPSIPVVYWEVVNEVNSPEPSIERIGHIIEKDPGMSAKVLQIVNVHTGPGVRISNICEAAALLGLENIKSFVLMVEIFSQYEQSKLAEGINLDDLWQHGLVVGQYAKAISEFEGGDKKTLDDSYTAGLLHDIGLLMLASQLPDEFLRATAYSREKFVPLQQAEKELFGATHAEIGGYLLDLWGLPDPVVEAISHHFFPSGSPDRGYESFDEPTFSPLTAVHMANYFCEDEEEVDAAKAEVDTFYLEKLGLSDRVPIWWDICAHAAKQSDI